MTFHMNTRLPILLISLLTTIYGFGQCVQYEIINYKKTAIAFGEKDYKHAGPLNNTLNDAIDISDSLKKIGFDVETYQNTDLETMSAAIDNWFTKIGDYDVALFYYSGHGAEVDGINYLFPIDANPKGPSDLFYSTYSANKVLDRMDESHAKVNIMILDACRNNPFTKSWVRDFTKGGLASMSGRGSFIGYAASPGNVAEDGSARNGTYTEGILKYIMTPDQTIDQIFTKVNSYVRQKTNDKQVPFKNSSLSVDFCFSVKRGKEPQYNRPINFRQPAADVFLSHDDKLIYALDNTSASVLVKDVKTLANLFSIQVKGKPFKVLGTPTDVLYVLDTLNNSLQVIDLKTKNIKQQIPLPMKPYGLALAVDNKKVFVSGPANRQIAVIDVVSGKISFLQVENCPTGLVVSQDGKFLLVNSLCTDKNSDVVILELRTGKHWKAFKEISHGLALGLAPGGKKMYVSALSNDKEEQLSFIDVESKKVIGSFPVKVNMLAFTADGKYLFALGNAEVNIIDMGLNEIINRLPLATTPKGLLVNEDGSALIWLPEENRMFAFDIRKETVRKAYLDSDLELKRFKKELTGDNSFKTNEQIKQLIENVNLQYASVINELIKELGAPFNTIQSGYGFNFKEQSFSNRYGIVNSFDQEKRIWPIYTIKVSDPEIHLIMKETEQDPSPQIFKTKLNTTNWAELKKFVRDYHILRLKKLR